MKRTELKSVRLDLDFTQRQMAGLLNISLISYKRYELGEREIPADVIERFYNIMARKAQHQLECSIDWLKIRFKTLDYKAVIREVLQMDISDFYDSEKTFYGYQDMVTFGNVRVLFSHDDRKIEEGTLIEFTGLGCREFELVLIQQKREWWEFLASAISFGETHRGHRDLDDFMSINRLDLALDELYREDGENIDLHDFKRRIYSDCIKINVVNGIHFTEGLKRVKGRWVNEGLTIYFGSRQSEVYIRFYQKDFEQALALNTTAEYINKVYGLKNRYEIELHGLKAFQVVMDYVNGMDVGEIGTKILTKYFEVHDEDGSLDVLWQELVGLTGGYKFVIKPKSYDYSRSKHWFHKSVSGTLLLMQFEAYLKKRDLLGEVVEEANFSERQEKVARLMAKKYKVDYEEVLDHVKGYC
ncbi:replication initiation factor domain-containing protein [Streptococcus canis]|uniref:replication initiation factor domain-containing protein n=1 Tax=Streptococcus canis TaxID=1329 RepID=UPI001143295F|nr:replication initiation factor domain-containing protein [Streptococcus canis]QKG76893.1 XRE family transcriptional regulator [Streptococcus canis]GEE06503.1 transposase [Streptococcus canis]GFG41170.1 transposase [Streptococcus canis]GMX35339.1 replication initiation factor domain-containing protein [Streptococcus canis]GMX39212.1 replication initiation factor domain-containing protein [Streptococcus canis]